MKKSELIQRLSDIDVDGEVTVSVRNGVHPIQEVFYDDLDTVTILLGSAYGDDSVVEDCDPEGLRWRQDWKTTQEIDF